MWWNFVGRSHDDIATYRELWRAGDARFSMCRPMKATSRGCPHRHFQTDG